MAISFDETNDYYSLADSASLTLPNSDWCIGTWTRVGDNTGSLFQYLLSNNGFGAANSLNFYLSESTEPTNPDKWTLRFQTLSIISSSAPGADGKDRLIVLQRAGSTVEMFFCEAGATAASQGTTTSPGAIDGGVWNIGRRVDGNADRYYGSIAGEFFKGDFSLTAEQVTALGNGLTILDLGHTPDVYIPFETAEATNKDLVGANDATRQDAPTTVEHFPIGKSNVIPVNFVAAAPAGGGIPIKNQYNYTPMNTLLAR